ncbi:MAG: flagellar basal body P-ring protein FlgI [Tepidisphaeraceae bacterium]
MARTTRARFDRPIRILLAACAALALGAGLMQGCSNKKKDGPRVKLPDRYTTLPPRKVPAFLKDTILEKCDLINTEPFLVSGYSVVVNLDNTGDGDAPNRVRDYIVKEMFKHKWGSALSGINMPAPEQALRDPRVAIVQVDGYLPPGIRQGQPFDIQVSALPESNTTSLAHGELFTTDLRIMGANPTDPGGSVNVFARASGPIVVNPAYALNASPASGAPGKATGARSASGKPAPAESAPGKPALADATQPDPAARRSLRYGIVMNGARSIHDRAIGLRIREPNLRLSRYIEDRVDNRLQEIKPDVIADAQDEAIVNLYVPAGLNGDWEHFAQLVRHLYLNRSPEFAAAKAKQLADEAVKPEAPLLDISYCWEGLGKIALPVIRERELMTHASEDVAYAAARAAAFLGDPTAPMALVKMAQMTGHRFQVNAVQVLGSLPSSPEINELLRPLLNSAETLVRLEAYKVLADNGDNSVFTKPVLGGPEEGGFILDIVQSDGPPVIYASRRGTPRIAVIGNRTAINLPITFSALDKRLMIASDLNNRNLTIYYRPQMPPGGPRTRDQADMLQPVVVASRPDVAEVIARLAGEGAEDALPGRALRFNYGEILAILSNMTSAQQLSALAGGTRVPASFIMQELPQVQDSIYNAPVIGDQGRPQTDGGEPGRVGMAK